MTKRAPLRPIFALALIAALPPVLRAEESATPPVHPGFAFEASNFPSAATSQRLYDELDYQRAVQAYIWGQPLVGLAAIAEGARRIGIQPNELFVFDQGLKVNQALQTGNDDVIYGGPNNDDIHGGAGDDSVFGDAGTDDVFGDAGVDGVFGGAGNDYVDGGLNDDRVYGADGNDRLIGDDTDTGVDKLLAGPGDDYLDAGPGDDTLYGLDGSDEMHGGDGSDKHIGGAGDDWIDGGPGDDGAIQGGPGNDVLIDGDGNDWLVKGDEGNDTVFLGNGADKVFSEQGDDVIYVLPDGFVDKIRCDDGTQENGTADRVYFVGWREQLDVVDPFGSCEIVEVVAELPAGWPYGPVQLPNGRFMPRTAGTDLRR